MRDIFLWTILYCITTPLSIVCLGSPKLIYKGKLDFTKIIKMLITPEFISGAILAFLSRLIFVLINNTVSKIPSLAPARTTVTVFISLISIITVIFANRFFLGDKLTLKQIIGSVVIITGVILVTT